jgi:hypothetical protein
MYCSNPDCPDYQVTGVHGEYVDTVTVCPYCGEPLVENLPAAAEGESTALFDAPACAGGDELELVFETSDPSEVAVVRSILDGADIPSLVRGEEEFDAFRGARSAFRFNPRGGAVRFLVPASRAEEARALLTEVDPEHD